MNPEGVGSQFFAAMANRVADEVLQANRQAQLRADTAVNILTDVQNGEINSFELRTCSGTCGIPMREECDYEYTCASNNAEECSVWCGREEICKQSVFLCENCNYGSCQNHGRWCDNCNAFLCTYSPGGDNGDCYEQHECMGDVCMMDIDLED